MLVGRGVKPELPLLRLPELNDKIWGLHKKELTIIGARPSNGKSDMAINVAYDLAIQSKKVLFLSLEMTIPRIIERMFCLEFSIKNMSLLQGEFNTVPEIQSKWEIFKKDMKTYRLNLSDMIGRQINDIEDILKDVSSPPDIIIIDHIQEISGDRKKEAIDKYLDRMREVAIRQDMAIVICSQINRISQEADDRSPQLHQLKGSGALEEKADNVILLHWPYHYDQGKDFNYFELNVAKNRNGPTGYIKLLYEPQHCRFSNGGEDERTRTHKTDYQESHV